jgi:hypothetical protein
MKKVVDVLGTSEWDRAFTQATMSDEELAHDYLAQKVGEQFRQTYPELNLSDDQIALLDTYHSAMKLPMSVAGVARAYNMLKSEGGI